MENGICRLSVIPVRAEGNDRSEQVTQLLFGEHYQVLERTPKWLRIRIHYDQYEGWIDHRQFTPISIDYYHEINISNYHFALEPAARLSFRENQLLVVKGSVLPITSDDMFASTQEIQYDGKTKPVASRADVAFLKSAAPSYLKAPYQWGGYSLKRDASQQALQGSAVKNLENALPGDLAFFASESGRITHVGMILEGSRIIHASGRVRIDALDERGILDKQTNTYSHELTLLRRFLKT